MGRFPTCRGRGDFDPKITDEPWLCVLYNVARDGATNPVYVFHNVSAAIWENDTGSEVFNSAHLFGFETLAAALPQSGMRTLQGVVLGRLISAEPGGPSSAADLNGTATITVNFDTRQVRLQMDLAQHPGAYSNTFNITNGSARFEGGLGGTNGLLSGNVRGSFFGSSAEEVGLIFELSGSDGTGEERIVGVVLAK